MTVGQVIVNVVLIATVPVAVLVAYRRERATVGRGVAAGAVAVTLVVVALLLIRGNLPTSPGTTLVMVVIAEEASKFLAVSILLHRQREPWHAATGPPASRKKRAATAGWSVGAGFAAAEHLLYVTTLPRIIILRIFTAGIVHLLTARLYAASLIPPDNTQTRRSFHMTGSLAAGVLLHLGYNLLARRLDQIPTLW